MIFLYLAYGFIIITLVYLSRGLTIKERYNFFRLRVHDDNAAKKIGVFEYRKRKKVASILMLLSCILPILYIIFLDFVSDVI